MLHDGLDRLNRLADGIITEKVELDKFDLDCGVDLLDLVDDWGDL